METRFLLAIHAFASPLLDLAFRISHVLASYPFCVALVLAAVVVHLLRKERRQALAWLAVGLTTVFLLEVLKHGVARARPELWPRLVVEGGFSFPSGHALASATFYPLLAYVLVRRRRPSVVMAALAVGAAMAFYIGVGRLYLGVHWPTDVMAGWALGTLQSVAAITWLRRTEPSPF